MAAVASRLALAGAVSSCLLVLYGLAVVLSAVLSLLR